jgi:hypothetical protein
MPTAGGGDYQTLNPHKRGFADPGTLPLRINTDGGSFSLDRMKY